MMRVWRPSIGSAVTFDQLYALVVLSLDRRRLWFITATSHPTSLWLAQQVREAFPCETAPKILVRDNDKKYGNAFKRTVRAFGIRDRPTSPYSPWQDGFVERVIGTIRRECLDHVLILNEGHLRRVLLAFPNTTMPTARTSRSQKMRQAIARSYATVRSPRSASSADFITGTEDARARKILIFGRDNCSLAGPSLT